MTLRKKTGMLVSNFKFQVNLIYLCNNCLQSLFVFKPSGVNCRFWFHPGGLLKNVLCGEAPPRGPSPKPFLAFTKSVNSNFHAFWLAPITLSIHGYLFCDQSQDGISFRDIFERQNLSHKSYKQIPRKRRTLAFRCLLVGRRLFSCWLCNKIVKMHLTKSPKCL